MGSFAYYLNHINYISLLAFGIFLFIRALYASFMKKAAAAKGYGDDAHAWPMCFWLGTLGAIYVVALPDLVHQRQNQRIIELLAEKQNNNTL